MFERVCYAPVMREGGFSLGIVFGGMKGYYETDYPLTQTYEEAESWARELNQRMGISEREEAELILQSLRK